MKEILKRSAFIVFAVLTLVVGPTICSALYTMRAGGRWPTSWPKELEPFRECAETQDWLGSVVYQIPFHSRDEFERIWPTIMKVKDKGASLLLRSGKAALVEFHTARRPRGLKIRGKEVPVGLTWPPESARKLDGTFPEYIMWFEESEAWVPYQKDSDIGLRWRALTAIELVVDGKVIDLNRIRLPAETPIVDKRRFEEGDKTSTRPASTASQPAARKDARRVD